MHLPWPTGIVVALLLASLPLPVARGESSAEILKQLRAALTEEADASKEAVKAREVRDSEDSRLSGLMQRSENLTTALSQMDGTDQLEGRGGYNYLSQIIASTRSEKVRKLCTELTTQVRAEREKKELEFLTRVDAAIKHAGEAAVSARVEKDLDEVLKEVGSLRDDRIERSTETGRRAANKLSSTAQFLSRWQDYLAQSAAGNPKAAQQILQNLVSNTDYPVVPRSEMLTRIRALTEAETQDKAAAASPVRAKVEEICAAVKTPEDIAPGLEKLTALERQFSGEVNNSLLSELGNLDGFYQQIRSDLEVPVGSLSPRGGERAGQRFAAVRAQLVRLALPRTLGLPADQRPAADETPGHYLDRMKEQARRTGDWPLLLRVTSASQTLATGLSGSTTSAVNTSLRTFIVGLNQEQAGQRASAVVSYEGALRDVDGLVPLDVVRERLAAIRKDFAADYEEGMKRVNNPPAPSYPNYPPGYPGFPGYRVLPDGRRLPLPGFNPGSLMEEPAAPTPPVAPAAPTPRLVPPRPATP